MLYEVLEARVGQTVRPQPPPPPAAAAAAAAAAVVPAPPMNAIEHEEMKARLHRKEKKRHHAKSRSMSDIHHAHHSLSQSAPDVRPAESQREVRVTFLLSRLLLPLLLGVYCRVALTLGCQEQLLTSKLLNTLEAEEAKESKLLHHKHPSNVYVLPLIAIPLVTRIVYSTMHPSCPLTSCTCKYAHIAQPLASPGDP